MIPLGFFSVCLKAVQLDRNVAFYQELGFEPTGIDAPGYRISLQKGPDALTFMSFLKTNLINFRGAHIYRIMCHLRDAGVPIKGLNERADQQRFVVDAQGKPLPENECGHFTVYDPDGHEIFFNTHPEERAPFEDALLHESANKFDRSDDETLIGRMSYCLYVADLCMSKTFYETLGLVVTVTDDCAWVSPPDTYGNVHFLFQLQQTTKTGVAVRFFQGAFNEAKLHAKGFSQEDDLWNGEDPEGRSLELLSLDRLPNF